MEQTLVEKGGIWFRAATKGIETLSDKAHSAMRIETNPHLTEYPLEANERNVHPGEDKRRDADRNEKPR